MSSGLGLAPAEHARRIRKLGLPETVVRIALEGGASVHPLLRGHADAVWGPAWVIADRHPGVVPVWMTGTVVTVAGAEGSVSRWSAELPDEPLRVFDDLAEAVRSLLTDLWELDDDAGDDDRRAVARLLLRPDQVEAALVPIER